MRNHKDEHVIEYFTRGQIGWGDWDGDGFLDPVDNCPDVSGTDNGCPDTSPPTITSIHAEETTNPFGIQNVYIKSAIADPSGIAQAHAVYKTSGSMYTSGFLPMQPSIFGEYSTDGITGLAGGTDLKLGVCAQDNAGNAFCELDREFQMCLQYPPLSLQAQENGSVYSALAAPCDNSGNYGYTVGCTDTDPPPKPALNPLASPDYDGEYTVSWAPVNDTGCAGLQKYELEETSGSGLKTSYNTSQTAYLITGKDVGTYTYRVRAWDGAGNDGLWSNPINVGVEIQPSRPPSVVIDDLYPASVSTTGTFNIRVLVTDPDGPSDIPRDGVVAEIPDGSGNIVKLEYHSSLGRAYGRDLPAPSTPGTHIIKVIVTDKGGLSANATGTLLVAETPESCSPGTRFLGPKAQPKGVNFGSMGSGLSLPGNVSGLEAGNESGPMPENAGTVGALAPPITYAATCKDVQGGSPVDITPAFRTNEWAWAYVHANTDRYDEDVYLEFYDPSGNFVYRHTYNVPDWSLDFPVYWPVWTGDRIGAWTVRVSWAGVQQTTWTLYFTVKYRTERHAMAHGHQTSEPYDPVGVAADFYATDEKAESWLKLDDVAQGLSIRWDWYDPSGTLYGSGTHGLTDPAAAGPDYWDWVTSQMALCIKDNDGANLPGDWRVNVYVDNRHEFTENFRIIDNIPPEAIASHSPALPNDAENTYINVGATDNGPLKTVELNWSYDGWNTEHTRIWNPSSGAFSAYEDLGVLPYGTTVEYFARASDLAGGWNETPIYSFTVLDKAGPLLYISNPSNGEILNASTVGIRWSANDTGTGLDHYAVQLDTGGWINVSSSTSYTFYNVTDGLHTVHVRAVDNVGNENVASSTFWVDTVLPPVLTPIANPSSWTSQNYTTVSWAGVIDGGSGVSHYEYQIDSTSGAWTSVGTATSFNTPALTSGEHVVYLRAVDNAGNAGDAGNVTAYIDVTPPDTPSPAAPTGWINDNTPSVSWDAVSDIGSGVAGYEYAIDQTASWMDLGDVLSFVTPALTEGVHYVYVRAYDRVENRRDYGTAVVKIDVTSPSITEMSHSPAYPTKHDDITISAYISDANDIKSVFLKYTTDNWTTTNTIITAKTLAQEAAPQYGDYREGDGFYKPEGRAVVKYKKGKKPLRRIIGPDDDIDEDIEEIEAVAAGDGDKSLEELLGIKKKDGRKALYNRTDDKGAKKKGKIVVKYKKGKKPKLRIDEIDTDIDEDIEEIDTVVAEVEVEDLAIEELKKNPDVEYAHKAVVYHALMVPSDPGYVEQWNMRNINAEKGWNHSLGRNVVIAVIDTGVDYTHVDLDDNVLLGYDWVNRDIDPMDDNGHGTHVAGIAAAELNGKGVVGVAPNSRILVEKVLDSNGMGYDYHVAKAIVHAVDSGADVITLSIGGGYSRVIEDACNYASSRGVLMAAAAGNGGEVLYPAALGTVIAVSALNSDNTLSSYSSTGAEIELGAPGGGDKVIYSTYPNDAYSGKVGTSMAAPHVSGVIALVKSLHPDWSSNQIREYLHSTAADLGGTGRDEKFGYGLVDAGEIIGAIPGSLDVFGNIYSDEKVELTVSFLNDSNSNSEVQILLRAKADLENVHVIDAISSDFHVFDIVVDKGRVKLDASNPGILLIDWKIGRMGPNETHELVMRGDVKGCIDMGAHVEARIGNENYVSGATSPLCINEEVIKVQESGTFSANIGKFAADQVIQYYIIAEDYSRNIRTTAGNEKSFHILSERVVSKSSPCEAGDFHYNTINDAENNARERDTIIICPGTYAENVKVTKGLDINGSGPSQTIVMPANANDHVFEITGSNVNLNNVTVSGAGQDKAGIYLYGVTGSTISDVVITNNYHSIILNHSHYNTLSHSKVINNKAGIFSIDTSGNNIIDNEIGSNPIGIHFGIKETYNIPTAGNVRITVANNLIYDSTTGILIDGSSPSNHYSGNGAIWALGNTLKNTGTAIALKFPTKQNILDNNTIENAGTGISLSGSESNAITFNKITGSTLGIYLGVGGYSRWNNIRENTLEYNSKGIHIGPYTQANSIYHNNFIENTIQAEDESVGKNPYWDSGSYATGGNYWSDWTGPDGNGDGVVDYEYTILNNKDRFPVTVPNGWLEIKPDTTPLDIYVESPVNKTYYGPNIPIKVSASKHVRDWWYSFNSGENYTFTPNTSINVPEGSHNITVYAEDPVGNLKAVTVYFNMSLDVTVCRSGCDFSTIQEGISAATPGGTVKVLDGAVYEQSVVWGNNNVTLDCGGATVIGVISLDEYQYMKHENNNNTIKNCVISGPETAYGISMRYNSGNNLINNTIVARSEGIHLYYSSYITIKDGTIRDSSAGITLDNANDVTISNTKIHSTTYAGINIQDSNNTVINNNNISNNNQEGIYIWRSRNTTITDNIVSNNSEGITQSTSINTAIINNVFSNNRYEGIALYPFGSNSNIFVYNNLFNNTLNVFGSLNSPDRLINWNITKQEGPNIVGGPYLGGNFWAKPDGTGFSETCADLDNDGICDSSYVLANENIDYLPLTYESIPPKVTLTSPQDTQYTVSEIELNVSVDEPIDSWWYSLDGWYNVTFEPNITLSGLSEGRHSIVVWAEDLAGNIGSDEIQFFVDTPAPAVDIITPRSGAYYSSSVVELNVSADEEIERWWYSINSGPNVTFNPNTTIDTGKGINELTVYANDTDGDVGFAKVSFTAGGMRTVCALGCGYKKIQEAIDDAKPGDSIIITDGTVYNEKIVWGSSNVTLDCGGATIRGDNTSRGIDLNGKSNNAIKNCRLEHFKDHIHLEDSEYNDLINNSADYSPYWVYDDWGHHWYPGSLVIDFFIYLKNSNHTNIVNNTVVYGDRSYPKGWGRGIYMDNSHHNNITYNTFNETIGGCDIDVISSDNNNITQNYLTGGRRDGAICLYDSMENLLFDNIVVKSDKAISLSSSDNNTILDNIIDHNIFGIELGGSHNNQLIGNKISHSSSDASHYVGRGIFLFYASYNTVFNNTLDNNQLGLQTEYFSNYNKFYHNNFIGNAQQAYIDGTNILDDGYPSGGNYWSDWTSPDANEDGVVDEPYIIPGGNNRDRYPVTAANGWLDIIDKFGPYISIGSPKNMTHPDSLIELNVSADEVVDSWWFSLDDDVNVTFTPNVTIAANEGPHTLVVYTNDTKGNLNSANVSFTVQDVTPPNVTIHSPENRTYAHTIIDLNVSTDGELNNLWHSINSGANQTFVPNTTIEAVEGLNDLAVYVDDRVGNINFQQVYFTIDTTPPTITITHPENNTAYPTDTVDLSYSMNEETSWAAYSLDGQENVTLEGNTTLFGLQDGPHSIMLHANDTVGHMSSQQAEFSVDTTPPTITPVSPENNTAHPTDTIELTFTVNEDTSWMAYSLDGQDNVTLDGFTKTISGLPDGPHQILLYVKDAVGHTSYEEIRFVVDTALPVISIISPQNATYLASDVHPGPEIDLKVTADEEVDSWWYSLNSGENTSFEPNITIVIDQGLNELIIYVNDTAGNLNYGVVHLTVDTVLPMISIASPQNDKTYNMLWIALDVSADESIDSWWYSLNSGENISFEPNISIRVERGINELVVYSNDSSGNLNFSWTSFTTTKEIITVCKSGCEYNTIQSGIDSAEPGDTVLITDGAVYNEGRPIRWSGDNVTLDCNGATIDGKTWYGGRSSMGVFLSGYRDIAIENCKIANFATGIYGVGFYSAKFINNSIENNTRGIQCVACNGTVKGNDICYNDRRDISGFYGTLTNSVFSNNACDDATYPQMCERMCMRSQVNVTVCKDGSCDYTSIKSAVMSAKPGYYIRVTDKGVYNEGFDFGEWKKNNITLDCDGATLEGSGAGYGILLEEKSYNNIKNCRIQNFERGIAIYGDLYGNYYAHSNSFENNVLVGNSFGIYGRNIQNNTFINNTIEENRDYGIDISSSNYNVLINNTVCYNEREGIRDSHNNEYSNNTCTSDPAGLCEHACQPKVVTVCKFGDCDYTSINSAVNDAKTSYHILVTDGWIYNEVVKMDRDRRYITLDCGGATIDVTEGMSLGLDIRDGAEFITAKNCRIMVSQKHGYGAIIAGNNNHITDNVIIGTSDYIEGISVWRQWFENNVISDNIIWGVYTGLSDSATNTTFIDNYCDSPSQLCAYPSSTAPLILITARFDKERASLGDKVIISGHAIYANGTNVTNANITIEMDGLVRTDVATTDVDGTYSYSFVAPSTEGNYTAKISATDASGINGVNFTTLKMVKDKTAPEITIYSPQNMTYPTNLVDLNVSANEAIDTWWYSFNDGKNITFGPNMTVNATVGPNHLVVYANDTVGNENSTSIYFTVVTTPPIITITSPQNTTYTSPSLELNVSADETVDSWWFNLNDNEVNETFVPGTVIEAVGGLNMLVIYANDSAGNLNSSTVWFYLNRLPVVVTGGPYDGTEGVPMDFSGLGTYDLDNDDLTYTWDFGDGTSGSGLNPAHTYAEDGIYTATLTVNDGYVSSSNTTYTNVSDVDPVANFSASSESGPEEPLSVDFIDLSSSYDGIVSLLWDFGDGSSSTEQSPSHEYRNGTYTITLTVHESDGDFDAASVDITVEDLSPTADFTWSPQPQNEGFPVQFTDTSTSYPDEIVSWQWEFGDGGSDIQQNTDNTYCDDGIYSASLSVTDEDGSQDLLSQDVVIVNVAPTADAGPDQVVDVFDTVPFDGSAVDPGCDTLAYIWDFGDGASTAGEDVTHAYDTAGIYSAVLNVKDGGGEDSDTASITVNKRETQLSYSGDVSGQYSDTVVLTALLTDKDGGVANKPIVFTIGEQSTTTVTDARGFASAGLILEQKPDQYTVSASFDEDEHYLLSNDTNAFEILKEETALVYLGDTSKQYSDTADVSAVLLDVDAGLPPEEAIKGIGEREVTFSIGAQSTSAVTGADGDSDSTIVIAQIPGSNYSVEAEFSGDDYYLPSSDAKPFYIAKEDTKLAYSGEVFGQYSDAITMGATLTDADSGLIVGDPYQGIPGEITMSIGSQEISGITDAAGHFSGELTLNQASGIYSVDMSFAGNEYYLQSSESRAFEILREDSVLTYTGDLSGQYSDAVVLRATISEIDEETEDLSNKNVMFTIGNESVSGVTDVNAGATTFMVLEQIPWNYTVEASFAGDEYYLPSTDTNAFEVLKEDAVISDPSVSIVYSDSVEAAVTLLDGDGDGILHKEEEPKVLLLEYDNGSAWNPLDVEVLDANNGVAFYLIIPETLDEVPQEYGLRANFEGDARYNPASTMGVMTVLKESTALSDPFNQVLLTDDLTIEVTLLDNDNETLLHQYDEQKDIYLDLNKGVDTWYVMSGDALASENDSDYELVLHFNISKLNLTDIAEAYELRARFDGDERYEGNMSRSCILNASVDARLLWTIHETEVLINATNDRGPLKYLNRTLEEMYGALYTCNHKDFYEHLKHASKNLRKAEKMGVKTDYIIEALVITARDKTGIAIVDAEELVGPGEKHVKKAWKHYYKALDKLLGSEDDSDSSDDDSDDASDDDSSDDACVDAFEKFEHAYKEAMKARAEWVPASYITGLQGALEEVQHLINDTNNKKALKKLEKAEEELSKALTEANETDEDRLEKSFDKVKDGIEKLEKAEKHGDDTSDIVNLLVENAADVAYQRVIDAESVVGYSPLDKAWKEYDEGMAKINETEYKHSIDSFKSAVKHAGKALEKGCSDKEDEDSKDDDSNDDEDSEDSHDWGSGEKRGEQEDREEEVDEENETDDSDSGDETDSKGKKKSHDKDKDKPDKPGKPDKPDKEAPPEDSKNPGKGGGKDKPGEGGQ